MWFLCADFVVSQFRRHYVIVALAFGADILDVRKSGRIVEIADGYFHLRSILVAFEHCEAARFAKTPLGKL